MWTIPESHRSFYDDWQLKSTWLQTNYGPEDHTGKLIADHLKEALESHSLSEEQWLAWTQTAVQTWWRHGGSITRAHIDVFEYVNKALSPLTDFTDAPSDEHYTSVSYLKLVLLRVDTENTDLSKTLKETIADYWLLIRIWTQTTCWTWQPVLTPGSSCTLWIMTKQEGEGEGEREWGFNVELWQSRKPCFLHPLWLQPLRHHIPASLYRVSNTTGSFRVVKSTNSNSSLVSVFYSFQQGYC